MSVEYEIRQKRWKKTFAGIEKDYDNLVKWWRKNKSCDCDSEEDDIFCKHYKKLLHETLGKRIDESWNLKLSMLPYHLKTIMELQK